MMLVGSLLLTGFLLVGATEDQKIPLVCTIEPNTSAAENAYPLNISILVELASKDVWYEMQKMEETKISAASVSGTTFQKIGANVYVVKMLLDRVTGALTVDLVESSGAGRKQLKGKCGQKEPVI
jgi:hypothetical protein